MEQSAPLELMPPQGDEERPSNLEMARHAIDLLNVLKDKYTLDPHPIKAIYQRGDFEHQWDFTANLSPKEIGWWLHGWTRASRTGNGVLTLERAQ